MTDCGELEALAAALDGYEPASAAESADVDRLKGVIASGNPWDRGHPLHVTASALVVDPATNRVLLRWHERMARWLQVGGHGDPGETDPWLVALREAQEETGLADLVPLGPFLERRPVQVVVVPVPAHGDEPAHEHADIRYVFATTKPSTAAAESDTALVRWLSVHDAKREVEESNLRDFLERVEQLLVDRPRYQ